MVGKAGALVTAALVACDDVFAVLRAESPGVGGCEICGIGSGVNLCVEVEAGEKSLGAVDAYTAVDGGAVELAVLNEVGEFAYEPFVERNALNLLGILTYRFLARTSSTSLSTSASVFPAASAMNLLQTAMWAYRREYVP